MPGDKEIATMELVDTTKKKAPRHMAPSSKDDEFDTPDEIYYDECVDKAVALGEDAPEFDPFTRIDKDGRGNSRCTFSATADDLVYTKGFWIKESIRGIVSIRPPISIWSNHPHTLHAETVELLHDWWTEYGGTVIMIIPSNTRRTPYWQKFIEPYRYGGDPKYKNTGKHIRNWPIAKNIKFEKNGKPSNETSRNAYEVVIWCKRKRSK